MIQLNKFFNFVSIVFIILLIQPTISCGERDDQKHNEIVKIYDERIKENPNNASLFVSRGISHYFLHNFDNAINDFKTAATIDPKFVLSYSALCDAYIAKEMYDEALDAINKALSINQKAERFYYQRAICYDNLSKNKEAINDYSKFIESKPAAYAKKELANALKRRAILYYKAGVDKNTINDATEALKIDQKDAELYTIRGGSYYQLNKFDEALYDFKTSINLNANYALSYFGIAQVYAAKKEKENTEKYLVLALKKGFNAKKLIYETKDIVDVLGKERIDALIARYSKRE